MSNEATPPPGARGRLVRVAPFRGAPLRITVDGVAVEAREGESILAAVLSARGELRTLEFNGEPRAGFCLMGACQDCWVWLGDGRRVRACTTPVAPDMAILTQAPVGFPRHG
jgi:NADH dehydrogenase/NADH:ubiquinone oxidoreductase subunit G